MTAFRTAIERVLKTGQARQIEAEKARIQRQHGLFQAAVKEFGLGVAFDPGHQGSADIVIARAAGRQLGVFQRQAVAITDNGIQFGLAEQALP